jgi:hypothetical protein
VWAEARDEAQIKHDVLATLMGLSAARLSDQLAGRGSQHLSVQRVLLLAADADGRRFLRVLCLKLAAVNGFDLETEWQIAKLQLLATRLIDRVQKRVPVKSELRESRERERRDARFSLQAVADLRGVGAQHDPVHENLSGGPAADPDGLPARAPVAAMAARRDRWSRPRSSWRSGG